MVDENFHSITKTFFIVIIPLMILMLWSAHQNYCLETTELELKDDYKAQRIGLESECDKHCNLKNKVVHQANWDNWNENFLCTCCDKTYTKDFWGNKYTGCETYSFNRKDWVQGVMAQRKGEK